MVGKQRAGLGRVWSGTRFLRRLRLQLYNTTRLSMPISMAIESDFWCRLITDVKFLFEMPDLTAKFPS